MRILVSGTGRSGTCLLTEVLRGLNLVKFTDLSKTGVRLIEDRKLFRYKVLPDNYGTKLVTDNETFTLDNITRLMEQHPDLYLIFTLRHPLDVYMSKKIRGQKKSDGGDKPGEWISEEAIGNNAIPVIKHFYEIYKAIKLHFSDRVFSVKTENLILYPEREVKKIATFFKVKPTQKAFEFYKYNRNEYHQNRYRKQIDKTQVGIHQRWATVYNGYFKNRREEITRVEATLRKIIDDLEFMAEDKYEMKFFVSEND